MTVFLFDFLNEIIQIADFITFKATVYNCIKCQLSDFQI